jgi:ribonuclease HI
MKRDSELLLTLAETLDIKATLDRHRADPAGLKAALRRGAGALAYEETHPAKEMDLACTCIETPASAAASADGAALVVNTDGASRGNPGPAAAGFALYREGKLLEAAGQYLGKQTNNQAEYNALILALKRALELGAHEVTVRTDSELMVRQIKGEYRVKNSALQDLFAGAKDLIRQFKSFRIQHVPREQNQKADSMANRAIDEFQAD